MHAKAMLFVDDGERQIAECHVVLEQSVRADDEVDVARGKRGQNLGALTPALAAGKDGKTDTGGGRQRRDGRKMLPRQNFSRRHDGGLPARFDHRRCGQQGDKRLARADVAMQKPQHRFGGLGRR